MTGLTDGQQQFLRSQNIRLDEMFDASGMAPSDFAVEMDRQSKLFAFGCPPCPYGHTLKTASNHCLQCNTAQISMIRAYYKEGYVYIAGSKRSRLIKVGRTDHSPWNKEGYLCSRKYGGITDWQMLYYAHYQLFGRVESNAQRLLSAYKV